MIRGSRKHVLDWTSHPEFSKELLQMVAPVDCRMTTQSKWMPRGYSFPTEARLESFGPEILPNPEIWQQLRSWWLRHERGANTPNWDIAASCEIEGTTGLILVEAKANVPELSVAGKSFDTNGSVESHENHDRITLAIAEACDALRRSGVVTAISHGTHYQLSNRVAFAWKLASLGVPVVLVYLGFLGDEGIRDVGPSFSDSAHWNSVFFDHARSVVPRDSFEKRIDCVAAPMWIQVRSRHVIDQSQLQRAAGSS